MTLTADILRKLAEGSYNVSAHVQPKPQNPTFVKMIVLEVISDPNTETNDEETKLRWFDMGVSNYSISNVLPRNTIIAKLVSEHSRPMFVFPFFPSHLSLPCKTGECVWVMFDNPNSDNAEIGYWFCRVVDLHISDDVNHSHPGRAYEQSIFPTAKKVSEAEKKGTSETGKDVWHELRNGIVSQFEDGTRLTSSTNNILRDAPEDIFEILITETAASTLTSYEAVPRFRKRPGDIAFEGSNNSLIVLGTDRNGSLSKSGFDQESGAIDVVVGRGYTPETLGTIADTTSMRDATKDAKGTVIKKEINKSPGVLSSIEGDPDYTNDRSRILVSQRTAIDSKFNIQEYNNQFQLADSPEGDAAITIKTDKVRIIARSDISMIVTNYSETSSSINNVTTGFKSEDPDQTKWASVTIKTNGDIVFTPSSLGYIKLGGDDADKGIVCSDTPVNAVDGNISGPSLVTTMGGFFAGSAAGNGDNSPVLAAGQAKFANKVLIK